MIGRASVEALEEKLNKLNQRLSEAREKIRHYEPQVENITSVQEAAVCEQFLLSALGRIQQSKAKFLGGNEFIKTNEHTEEPVGDENCEKQTGSQPSISLSCRTDAAGVILYSTSICVKNLVNNLHLSSKQKYE
ncbi:uncharacterized protein LOC132616841 isoform X1 [Lycium barbarum]|uniref:uncharacterized protein LOC132616841 isoform X1 n=1 Tax=Lycium barbarum TaxID=112863 RepID=UPI00293E0D0C|nr:uncharacterized protein LOC132616841 isoform X1 [Lycium barbarum]